MMQRKTQENRYKVILVALLVLMALLIWKLFQLMIVQGEDYRRLSESKRTKEITLIAPRGNIYDRKGVLLAGTRISYAVQSYKDEFLRLDKDKRDRTLTDLVKYMDQDGVDYLDQFPIASNIFCYQQEDDYFKEGQTAQKKAEQILIDRDLVGAWIERTYQSYTPTGTYEVSMAARALKIFSLKGHALPLRVDSDQGFAVRFDQGSDRYKKMVEQGQIRSDDTPMGVLAREIAKNPTMLSQIMSHPAARKLAYDLIKERELTGNLTLRPYAYSYQEALLQKKGLFHQAFPGIGPNTTAREDFVTMLTSAALDEFLTSMEVGQGNHFVIPAEKLINQLAGMEKNLNLTYRIQADAKSVSIEYEKEENTTEKALDRLERLAKDHQLLPALITEDAYKNLAQNALFNAGIYPGILIGDWQYGLAKDNHDFLKRYKVEEGENPEATFLKLMTKRHLSATGDAIWDYGKLVTEGRIIWQADYAYTPVNLCYELSANTVAKLQEHIPDTTGIMVSREAIRYYPHGETACHILGYIGKIATDGEIEKYVKTKGYQPNELVGKTGVEEAFEDTLHGVSGKEVVMIDSRGNRTETLSRKEPKSGNNLYLTIDYDFQAQSEAFTKNTILSIKYGLPYQSPWGDYKKIAASRSINSGSMVSVDPKTGELLAMVSYPMYDPNLFVTGISASDWERLNDEQNPDKNKPKPLMNLISQTAVQPGSIFKTVVGLSALDHGLNPKQTANCSGYMDVGDTRFRCWIFGTHGGAHGRENLYTAIRDSCNYYFYTLGLGKDPKGASSPNFKLDIDQLGETARKLHMDQPSGLEINVPRETKAAIPSKEGKLELSITLLKRFLEENLPRYKKTTLSKNPSVIQKDIQQILSWANEKELVSRNTVIKRLDALGYDPITPQKGSRSGLADILKYSYFNQIHWTQADALNTMIGQGQNAYSPLTMLKVTAAIASHGQSKRFTLVREIRGSDNKTMVYKQTPKDNLVDIPETHFQDIQKGMELSAGVYQPINHTVPFQIASKTGTATRDDIDPRTGVNYTPYAWTIGFAPAKDPQIATVIFAPLGNTSVNLLPLLRDSFASYLKSPIVNENYREGAYDGYVSYEPLPVRPDEEEKGGTQERP